MTVTLTKPVLTPAQWCLHDGQAWLVFGGRAGTGVWNTKTPQQSATKLDYSSASFGARPGVSFSSGYLRDSVISFDSVAVSTGSRSALEVSQEFARFIARGAALEGNATWALSKCYASGGVAQTLTTYGRPTPVQADVTYVDSHVQMTWSFQVALPYWVEELPGSAAVTASTTGQNVGLSSPLVSPLSTTTPSDFYVTLENPYYDTVYPTFAVEGPLHNPELTVGDKRVKFSDVTLTAGQTLTVTTLPGAVSAVTSDGASVAGNINFRLNTPGQLVLPTGSTVFGVSGQGIEPGVTNAHVSLNRVVF